MAQPRQCPKCSGGMAEGFILDSDAYGGTSPAHWVEGKPKRSFWMGLKLGGAAKLEITTFRCERCGYLENYALPE